MRRRSAGSAGRARLALLLVAALCIPGLLSVATANTAAGGTGGTGDAGPVSSNKYSAAASFADLGYSVPFYGIMFGNTETTRANSPEAETTNSVLHFAEVGMVERDGSDLDLSFAVEGQPEVAEFQVCWVQARLASSECQNVNVGVTPKGHLYLHLPWSRKGYHQYLAGFPRQPVELSASDADSGLKVYREVMVEPPAAATGCEDYGDNTPETYTCLFLRELLPSGPVTGPDEQALRAGLPPLVQDSANYSLVFAEEFNGDPPAADDDGCSNGMSTLDNAVWNAFNACISSDSRGESCGNIADGAFVMGIARTCASELHGNYGAAKLNSYGKLHFKYGYIEIKYTFNLDRWSGVYSNHNLILYTRNSLRHLRDSYGVEIEDWEDYLKNTEVEIDLVEIPGAEEVAHQYANWDYSVARENLAPTRTYKFIKYCGGHAISILRNTANCARNDTFTVTKGFEWTPRGYRTCVKVDEIASHSRLTLVPKDKILIHKKYVNGRISTNSHYEITGSSRDRYFEYLDPEDTGSLLEQVAVAHIPLPIAMSAWGFLTDAHPYIRTRMKIDYIRVWQPENLYTDMEPVYQ